MFLDRSIRLSVVSSDLRLTMRRSTKPFTVEVKKRGGGRRRDVADAPSGLADPPAPSFGQMVGRDMRFRDAENLFRTLTPVEAGFAEPEQTLFVSAEPPPQTPDAAPRRILPDLVAEAALSDATVAAEPAPAPRRRGRPPKDRDALPQPAKSRTRAVAPADEETIPVLDMPEPVLEMVPAVLYLEASARRRAARATDNLPRAERWKRRLPKVCW